MSARTDKRDIFQFNKCQLKCKIMDRHFFISVSTCKSNRMGEELQSYVELKYHHMVVHKDDFYDIKADIENKMEELQEKYMRCKPFRVIYMEFRDCHGVECPNITVRPDNDTDKVVLCLRSSYVRNAILEYRRP